MHLDGVERMAKEPEITQHAVLEPRDGEVCGESMSLCPSSMNGGCCPDGYECGKNSCFATTRGPATCGTLVGWYACAAVNGGKIRIQPEVAAWFFLVLTSDAPGGCCPDGYMCQAGKDCIPPSGAPYTFDCPASHYLCPESLSYGCCPDGMGCAINQCYSTESQTITTDITVTTTEDGERTTYTTRTTTVKEPDVPTELPEVDVDDDEEQRVLKYFPSAVPKESPTSDTDGDDDGGGLSNGQLAGIVTGAVAFLIIVIVAAFIIIRHLNKVVAAVSDSRQSGTSSRVRPAMKEFKPTDSEIDVLSVDPLIMSPRPSNPRTNSTPGAASSTDLTPSSFAGAYQAVSIAANSTSRHQSWESGGNMGSYFDYVPGRNARYSLQSGGGNRVSSDSNGTYQHVRQWSNTSDGSNDFGEVPGAGRNLAQELEANTVGPELPGSATSTGSLSDEEEHRRRSSGSVSMSSVLARPPPSTHQRLRSGTARGHELSIVDEEAHGYHGPRNRMAGETARPSSRGSWREGDDASL